MVQALSIAPSVAAYALIKTDCRGVGDAVDFIFEKQFSGRQGRPGLMQHPYVAYQPELLD